MEKESQNTPLVESKAQYGSNWRIIESTFERSVTSTTDLITDGLPEVAFVGRSNVGKSSLLNALCARKALARVSKTPGRTQAINLFTVRVRQELPTESREKSADLLIRFSDLPGYGYAKVSASMRKSWQVLMADYLQRRKELSAIVLVHDSRRILTPEELWFFESCNAPIILAMSKADKLSRKELEASKREVTSTVTISSENLVPTSVLRSNDLGLQKLVNRILFYVELGVELPTEPE